MKTKIFPKPAPPYSATDELERYEQVLESESYPWPARLLGAFFGIVFWAISFMFLFGFLPGDVHDVGTYLAIGSIGAGLAFVISVPFICK